MDLDEWHIEGEILVCSALAVILREGLHDRIPPFAGLLLRKANLSFLGLPQEVVL